MSKPLWKPSVKPLDVVIVLSVLAYFWYSQPLAPTDDSWKTQEIFFLVPGKKTVDFSNRNWSSLPVGFVEWANVNEIEILFLSSNAFTEIPSQLAMLSHLKMLSMRKNKISNVHTSSLPKGLIHLILTDNEISHLHLHLSNLKKLMLARNRLKTLEGLLAPELELLRVPQNLLQEFPSTLLQTSRALKWVSFMDNPFCVCNNVNRELVWMDSKTVFGEGENKAKSLGQGTSGVAYRMENNQWVFKSFKENSSDGSPESEMLIGALLPKDHESILAPVGRTMFREQTGMVFRFVEGKPMGKPPTFGCEDTFDDSCQRFTVQEWTTFAAQATCALRDMHRAHVIHGDLYAHNTLLSPTRLVFLDFGAATCVSAFSLQEQAGMKALDSRALGVLLQNALDHLITRSNDKDTSAAAALAKLIELQLMASQGQDAESLCDFMHAG